MSLDKILLERSFEDIPLVVSGEQLPLKTHGAGAAGDFTPIEAVLEKVVTKVIQRELSPILAQMRNFELTLKSLTSQLGHNTEKLKEVTAMVNKEPEPLKKLVTSAGLIALKKAAVNNLQQSANSDDEKELMCGLMQDLRMNNNIVNDCSKTDCNLLHGFREYRSNMRQQIKRRLVTDLTKKDNELKETVAYISKGVGCPAEEPCLTLVFNTAYIMARYMNDFYDVTGPREEAQRRAGKKAIWELAAHRQKTDPLSVEQLMLKLKTALAPGYKMMQI